MGRLSLYTDDRGTCAMHESGFSWLAAISPPLWALRRRLYGLAAASLLLTLAVGVAATQWQWPTGIQTLLYGLMFGLDGALANRLHRWLLERGGWTVTAREPAARPGAAA